MTDIRPTQKEIEDAIDRIAMTSDGRNLYIYLQRRVMKVTPVAKSGALRTDQGERSFAANLIGLMAKGIAESGGRTSSSSSTGGSSGTEQPVVVPVAKPVSLDRSRGAGRRIGPEDRGFGYDIPDGV